MVDVICGLLVLILSGAGFSRGGGGAGVGSSVAEAGVVLVGVTGL
jgi:hypothetical protein